MTTTEDREARLAAMRVGDPATPEPTPGFESNGSTVLESRLSQLETSVGTLSGSIEQLATIQNATTNALNTLVARAQAPDNSRTDAKIDELAKRVETLAAESVTAETAGKLTAKIDEIGIMVAELKQRPKRPSEMRLSQAQLDEMTKTVTDHVTKGVANLKPSMDAGKVGRFLVERLGESVAQRSAEHADAVADQLDDAAARLEAANGQAEQLSRSLSAAGLARVALAMVPVAVTSAVPLPLMVSTEPGFASVSVPLIFESPLRFRVAPPEIVRLQLQVSELTLTVPLEKVTVCPAGKPMKTLSVAFGTDPVLQLLAVFQFPPAPPIQVLVAAGATGGV